MDPSDKLPSFPGRFLATFVSPGRLTEGLAARPLWVVALVVMTALVALQMILIPAEIWEAFQRAAALEAGRPMPEMSERASAVLRWVIPAGAAAASLVMAFVLTGLVTLVFVFVLGDEGTYKQHLAVMAHAFLIPSTLGLLLVPLRIAQENPQFTLSLGSFAVFLPDGYLLNVLNLMDLSQMWSWAVVAMGAHAIDRRRGFGFALAVLLTLQLGIALLMAIFVPTA